MRKRFIDTFLNYTKEWATNMRKFLFLLLFILAACSKQTAQPLNKTKKQTLCLNMIVKNEAPVICRCLESVKDLIDYWVIVDTGSNDGTQKVIKKFLNDIPGELHERRWKNWGETRSEAFNLARGKGDYILFMDADDILQLDEGCNFGNFEKDLYTFWRGNHNCSYLKPQIVRGDLPWKWIGVTHEYLTCDQPYSDTILEGAHYITLDDGATHKTGVAKYWKNVELLEDGLKQEPGNSRYMFYLAESYRCCNEKGKALEWYQKRVEQGGWAEEVYWSKLQIAHMLNEMGTPYPIVIEAYKDAFNYRPHRVEAPYYMAAIFNQNGQYVKAYEMLKMAAVLPKLQERDWLFNEDWIKQYGLDFQLSIAAYYIGSYEEALASCDQILQKDGLSQELKDQTAYNRAFSAEKLLLQSAEEK